MKRAFAVLLLSVFWGMCTACSRAPHDSHELLLADFPEKRVECAPEWRIAKRFPVGENRVIRLPLPEPPASFSGKLRIGILEGMPGEARATLRIYVGRQCAGVITPGAEMHWRDYSIALPEEPTQDNPCRIVSNTTQDLWVSPCEVTYAKPTRPNILVYLVDTLRLDHLGCYGYARNTSPNIDAFRRDGIQFTQLMPQASWTKPSVASLFTSTYPNVHGAQDRPDMLREGLPSLAGALRRAGYETHAFITNTNLLPLWGFGDGFSRYVNVEAADFVNCDDAKVVDTAIEAIHHAQGRPWFLHVHAMGPHAPYEAPGTFLDRFARPQYDPDPEQARRQQAVDRYDGEIAYSDAQFRRLLDTLRELGAYDSTLIIFLSDHGEEFWEHGGFDHGKTLYEEMLRVPLLIKLPAQRMAGQSRDALIEMVDIAPTVLEILGLPEEKEFEGQSFHTLLETNRQKPRMGYATLVNLAASLRTSKNTDTKYLLDAAGHKESWFSLTEDPGEHTPLATIPESGAALRIHASRMGIHGAQGLHLLMTCGEAKHTVTGSIQGAGFGPFDLHYYNWKSDVKQSADAVHFTFLTKHATDVTNQRDVWHTQFAEQDNAHLRIPMTSKSVFRLEIQVDGKVIPPESLFLGGLAESAPPLPDTELHPFDLLGDANLFDPAGLPRKFAVYVWYVAPEEEIQEEDLDPKIRENLQALGYL